MLRATAMVALFCFSIVRVALLAMRCLLRKMARIALYGLLFLYFLLGSGTAHWFAHLCEHYEAWRCHDGFWGLHTFIDICHTSPNIVTMLAMLTRLAFRVLLPTCIYSLALPQDNNRDLGYLSLHFSMPSFSHCTLYLFAFQYDFHPVAFYFSFAKIAQPVPCKYRCWNRFIHIYLHKISTRFPHFLLYARWWLNKMWFFKIFLVIPCISHFPLLAPICT